MSDCTGAQVLIGCTYPQCCKQPLKSNLVRVDLIIYDYSIETEPKACMVPCGLIHEERPVTQKRGHALMFEEDSGARTYSLGPRRND